MVEGLNEGYLDDMCYISYEAERYGVRFCDNDHIKDGDGSGELTSTPTGKSNGEGLCENDFFGDGNGRGDGSMPFEKIGHGNGDGSGNG